MRLLPFGDATVLNRCKTADGGVIFTKTSPELMKKSDQLFRKEALMIQYLCHVRWRETSLRCLSDFTAGPGQPSFGSSSKRKVDGVFLVSPGVVRVVNFHEEHHQEDLRGHDPGCKHRTDEFGGIKYDADTMFSDSFNRDYAERLSSTGLWKVDYETISECL